MGFPYVHVNGHSIPRYGMVPTEPDDVNDRLVNARERAGYPTAADAARALGIKYQTYAAHENGNSGLRPKVADRYARKFRVSLDWLLTGRGELSGDGVQPLGNDVAGLPVLGSIQAGHWLDATLLAQDREPELLP